MKSCGWNLRPGGVRSRRRQLTDRPPRLDSALQVAGAPGGWSASSSWRARLPSPSDQDTQRTKRDRAKDRDGQPMWKVNDMLGEIFDMSLGDTCTSDLTAAENRKRRLSTQRAVSHEDGPGR